MTLEIDEPLDYSNQRTPFEGKAGRPGTGTALVPIGELALPNGMTAEEAAELRQKAAATVAELREATGSKQLTLIDSITAVGIQTQRRAGADLELLRLRVSELVGQDRHSAGTRVAGDLGELRLALNRIDPRKVSRESLLRRGINLLPFGRAPLLRVLETIAVRYEPVSQQVGLIETRLREGRMLLNRDNIELRKLYEQVEAQQQLVQKNCYLAELILQQLDMLVQETEDPGKRDRLQDAVYDVATRAQDLRLMDETDHQLFVALEMTRQNNTRLARAVDRSLTLVSNVVMVGLAIQSALARQRRVLEATNQTRDFLGDLLVANASAIKQHTLEIGDVYKSPVIAIEKIERAHQDLLDAIDNADQLRSEGVASARENIARLTRLAGELQQRLPAPTSDHAVPALEA